MTFRHFLEGLGWSEDHPGPFWIDFEQVDNFQKPRREIVGHQHLKLSPTCASLFVSGISGPLNTNNLSHIRIILFKVQKCPETKSPRTCSTLGCEVQQVSEFVDLFKIYPEWSGMVPGPSQTL